MGNVRIQDVRSEHRDAYGLRVFDGCDVEFNELFGDVSAENMIAGKALDRAHDGGIEIDICGL